LQTHPNGMASASIIHEPATTVYVHRQMRRWGQRASFACSVVFRFVPFVT
jgi:hypothetical protein